MSDVVLSKSLMFTMFLYFAATSPTSTVATTGGMYGFVSDKLTKFSAFIEEITFTKFLKFWYELNRD